MCNPPLVELNRSCVPPESQSPPPRAGRLLEPPPLPSFTPAPPPAQEGQGGLSAGAIAGISVGIVALVLALGGGVGVYYGCCVRASLDSAGSGRRSFKDHVIQAKKYKLSEIQRLTGDFDEARVLGRGGFGVVYLGETRDGTKCAVKRETEAVTVHDGSRLSSFEREIIAISKLRHRNLVCVLGYCAEQGEQVQVLEYAANGSLADRLHKADEGGKDPLLVEQRLRIACDVASGIRYLHGQGIIHRDIKPGNVLLCDTLQAKVADFGLARDMEEEGSVMLRSRTGVVGTPGYVDPQYAAFFRVTKASDVYSFGVLLLELMTGRRPHVNKPADIARALEYEPRVLGSGRMSMEPVHSEASFASVSTVSLSSVASGRGLEKKSLTIKLWVEVLLKNKDMEAIVDPDALRGAELEALQGHDSEVGRRALGILTGFFKLALACVGDPDVRPTMDDAMFSLQKLADEWMSREEE